MSAQGATSTHAGQYALAIALEIGGQGFPITSETGTLHGPWSIWSAFDRVADRFKASVEYKEEPVDGRSSDDPERGFDWRVEAERRQQAINELNAVRAAAAQYDLTRISNLRADLDELREEHEEVVREFDVVVDERDAALKRVEDLELKLAAYERAVEGNKVAG